MPTVSKGNSGRERIEPRDRRERAKGRVPVRAGTLATNSSFIPAGEALPAGKGEEPRTFLRGTASCMACRQRFNSSSLGSAGSLRPHGNQPVHSLRKIRQYYHICENLHLAKAIVDYHIQWPAISVVSACG